MIKVNKLNDVHLQLDCEPHIGKELSEHFSFYVHTRVFLKHRDILKGLHHLALICLKEFFQLLAEILLSYFLDKCNKALIQDYCYLDY